MALPAEVERFLIAHVDSVAALETLIALHAWPKRTWTAQELARELRITPDAVTRHLRKLVAKGFANEAVEPGRFVCGRVTQELALVITSYRAQPSAVITAIYSKPQEWVHTYVGESSVENDTAPNGRPSDARRHRVLIVEDDSAMRRLLADALREAGHQVETVASGLAAIERLRGSVRDGQEMPDVLVSDMRMPGFTGLEMIRRLRELHFELSAFLMTAFGTTELRNEAYAIGVLEVFDKPFDLEELLTAIRRLDGERQSATTVRSASGEPSHT